MTAGSMPVSHVCCAHRTCSVAVSLRGTLLGEAGTGPATAAISTAARGGALDVAPLRAVPPLLLRRVLASAVMLMLLMMRCGGPWLGASYSAGGGGAAPPAERRRRVVKSAVAPQVLLRCVGGVAGPVL